MNTSRSSLLNAPPCAGRDVSGPPVTAAGYFVPDKAAACEGAANMRWYRDIISPSVIRQGAFFMLLPENRT